MHIVKILKITIGYQMKEHRNIHGKVAFDVGFK